LLKIDGGIKGISISPPPVCHSDSQPQQSKHWSQWELFQWHKWALHLPIWARRRADSLHDSPTHMSLCAYGQNQQDT